MEINPLLNQNFTIIKFLYIEVPECDSGSGDLDYTIQDGDSVDFI